MLADRKDPQKMWQKRKVPPEMATKRRMRRRGTTIASCSVPLGTTMKAL
jgi:hypothetical protein